MTKKKLAQWIVKGRYVLLALMAVCIVLSVLTIGKTRINYDLTRYLSDNTMTKKALKIMEAEFSASEQLRVMFTDQPEEAVTEYAAEMAQLPGVLAAMHDPESGVRQEDGKTYRLVSVTLKDGDAAEYMRILRIFCAAFLKKTIAKPE